MSDKRAASESSGLIRIEATSYREALRDIGDRFGSEYSIVHTRVIRRKGMKGLLGVTGVEVYVTNKSQYHAWREHSSLPLSGQPMQPGDHEQPGVVPQPGIPPAAQVSYGMQPGANPPPPAPPRPRVPYGAATIGPLGATPTQKHADLLAASLGLSDEVNAVQDGTPQSRVVLDRLNELQDQMRALLQNADGSVAVGGGVTQHPIVGPAEELLARQGFSHEARAELIEGLQKRHLPGVSDDPEELIALARVQLTELIRPKIPPCMPINKDADRQHAGPHVVMMVGPTGVGKTTTIAKLASPMQLVQGKSVGLVTLDTYRIGAVDQLQRYAEIMGLPLQVVQPGDHMPAALSALQGCDVIFVDTAGRNQRDQEHLQEVRGLFTGIANVETHLCVAMTSSRDTLRDVVQSFGAMAFNRILITKMDEAPRGGALYDLIQVARVPLSYLTCGQEVPDDIQAASVDRVLKHLLGD